MQVSFVTRSKFLPQLEEAFRSERTKLDHLEPITIILEDGGYNNNTIVIIDANNRKTFESDMVLADVTRFPARIRATVTALRNCGCDGRYEVSHQDGIIVTRKT